MDNIRTSYGVVKVFAGNFKIIGKIEFIEVDSSDHITARGARTLKIAKPPSERSGCEREPSRFGKRNSERSERFDRALRQAVRQMMANE